MLTDRRGIAQNIYLIVIGVLLVLFAGSVALLVVSRPKAEAPLTVNVPSPAKNTNIAPTSTSETPAVGTIPTNDVSAQLTVNWLEHPEDVKVDPATVFSPSAFLAMKQSLTGDQGVYDPSYAAAWKTGTVTSGPYDGRSLYRVVTGAMSGDLGPVQPPLLVVMVDPATHHVSLLSAYDAEFVQTQEMPLFDDALPNVSIPDLDAPEQFTLKGYTFKKWGYGFSNATAAWFSELPLVQIDRYPHGAGFDPLYTTTAATSTPGAFVYPAEPTDAFYLRLADDRVVSYTFDIPFVSDQRIPQLTWSDGTVNVSDYSWADSGGCGSRNAYAVRDESSLKPATRLVAAGHTSTSETIYTFKSTSDPELKEVYDTGTQYVPEGQTKPTFAQFIAKRPVFYWQDAFGRWIRFVRNDVLPQVECGKPVIYLYPQKDTSVHVAVGLKGKMTASEPAYGNGWNVTAHTDGTVTTADGKTYPNLFWEGTGVNYKTPAQGFVVKTAEADAWLTQMLATIGFTERESAEFREFWVPRLPKTPYVFITFVPQADFDRDAPLMISPRPDKVYRVFMEYRGLEAPISVKPLTLPKIERAGFTVVEWGGALKK